MPILLMWVLVAAVLVPLSGDASDAPGPAATAPLNFVYFGLERSRIADDAFLETDAIVGAQLKYTWKELEPEKDHYEIYMILEDLAFLEEHGKKLFIQIQDFSFVKKRYNVPDYVVTDAEYGGGVAGVFEGNESALVWEGWVARRWDPSVRSRFVKLIRALGRELDGKIEGVNLAETAIGFGRMESSTLKASPTRATRRA